MSGVARPRKRLCSYNLRLGALGTQSKISNLFRQWRIPIGKLIDTQSSHPCRLNAAKSSDTNFVTPRTGSAVAGYCPLWAWLHSHQPARFCFWELTKQLPRVVTHPGIAPASNSLNFGVPTNSKPVSSQKASYYFDARCAI
ncbi:hypothetical protein L3X38_018822 [Prunus dulcis]|uniref:Uncharacterized protein n=1 Tax=Prunus dulcis TaxID=3755 RepID=A0AAD4ZB37_PRUDU|nr:hypothetical protein L3X38_018822 [Prunus dulcis]